MLNQSLWYRILFDGPLAKGPVHRDPGPDRSPFVEVARAIVRKTIKVVNGRKVKKEKEVRK